MFSHSYNILIDCGVGAPGYDKYVVDGLNDTNKRFLAMLMTNVQLTGETTKYLYMFMHTSMIHIDTSLTRVIKKYFGPNTGTWIYWSWKIQ